MKLSNTWFVDHCMDWKGICVEANPDLAKGFEGSRSCTIVNKAVTLAEGEAVQLTREGASGTVITGGSASAAAAAAASGVQSSTATMARILYDAGWTASLDGRVAEEVTVDFLSLDVEDFELEVLLSMPWDSLNVRFICVENKLMTLDVSEFLLDRGYALIASYGMDDIYARLPSGRPLQRSGQMEYMRRSHATLRMEGQQLKSYLHKALYKGWNYVLEAVSRDKRIPAE
jgi:hypothetical protein